MKKTNKQRLKEKCVSLAMEIYLLNHCACEMCGQRATVAHHFIHQSRSNYLRCDMRNLVALCQSCHYKVHSCGYEQVLTGQLIKQRGMAWFDSIMEDSHKTITDTKEHWENVWNGLLNQQGGIK
jgi:hypothetical protein